MTVRLYQSTDGDAPILNGTDGNLVQVLEACLVTGYTGKPGLGWEIDRLADQTKAALRSSDPASSGCWLYLEDFGTLARGIGLEADAWGGFDASDDPVIDGNRFPTETQVAGGSVWAKSRDASTVPWILVADERLFYLFVDVDSLWGNGGGALAHGFGDLSVYVPSDLFGCVIGARQDGDVRYSKERQWNFLHTDFGGSDRAYMARPATGAGDPNQGRATPVGQSVLSTGGAPYPLGGSSSGYLINPVHWVEDGGGNMRAQMPGMYSYYHDRPVAHGHIETTAEGRELLAIAYNSNRIGTDPPGYAVIDITGPWR